jgi:hypothetical protein
MENHTAAAADISAGSPGGVSLPKASVDGDYSGSAEESPDHAAGYHQPQQQGSGRAQLTTAQLQLQDAAVTAEVQHATALKLKHSDLVVGSGSDNAPASSSKRHKATGSYNTDAEPAIAAAAATAEAAAAGRRSLCSRVSLQQLPGGLVRVDGLVRVLDSKHCHALPCNLSCLCSRTPACCCHTLKAL